MSGTKRWRRPGGSCAKQTQFPAVPGESGSGGGDRFLPSLLDSRAPDLARARRTNKANFPEPAVRTDGSFCETKPISAGAELELTHVQEKRYATSAGLGGWAKQSQFVLTGRQGRRGAIVQNKANWPPPGPSRKRRSWRAGAGHTNKANLEVAAAGGRKPVMQNKPNWRGPPAEWVGQAVQTNPISLAAGKAEEVGRERPTPERVEGRPYEEPRAGITAGFLLLALRPRVTIVFDCGLATEFTRRYRRVRQIAM